VVLVYVFKRYFSRISFYFFFFFQLIRSLTEPNEEQIKASVELGSNRDLIGDRSRPHLLPQCKSRKHPDLACISPQTVRQSNFILSDNRFLFQLVDVLQNVYSSEIENLHIIDCRYPYEYEGGHIQSAKNLYTRSQIYNDYFRKPLELKDSTKRNIFIFHCEFSSERAPSLYVFK
jgi:M-phase inducer phosphatase